jgi:hypothetical protein
MPVWLRVALLSFFIVTGSAALIVWIIIPLLKMSRLGKTISHEQAATIIGRHFPEISDKLLNILQLHGQSSNHSSRELIAASIEQKSKEISVVPITRAIDLSRNKRYIPYLLPPVIIAIIIMVVAPNIFSEASQRLLQPTKTFEKPAPFKFIIDEKQLLAVRNADLTINVSIEGDAIPEEVMISTGKDQMPMQPTGKNKFRYIFRNVTEPITFRFFAAGFYSHEYTVKVAQKPVLKAFKVEIDYPAYTLRKDEVRNSLGDLTLPAGTIVRWAFMADYTDFATLKLGDGAPTNLPKQANLFATQFRFLSDTAYTFSLHNKQNDISDDYQYQVKVIPDQYPVIQLEQLRDSLSGKQILLTGTAGDDYGITRVLFHYQITSGQNQTLVNKSIPLNSTPGALTTFQHYFDIQMLNLQPGQKLSYFIEAWDNDGVHGSKATRSDIMAYQMFKPEQLDSAILENSEQISSGLNNSSSQTKQLQQEYRDMQSKMLQGDKSAWESQESMQSLANMQQQLKNQLEKVKQRLEEQMQQTEQKQFSQDLKEKQKELKAQMDNLLNKELAEQMKKLQELMEKLNKENPIQAMKQLEQENKLFNMDLQRMQELMKKMEMQMRMEDMANKLDKLADQQMKLKNETDKGTKDTKQLAGEQKDIKKELDKVMDKDMKEMQDLNKEMKQQQDLDEAKEDGKDAQDEMKESEQQLNENQKSKSSQSQKNAAQSMKKMASSMRSKAGGMEMEQLEIDIKATRQLLTNLMRLSFDQEQLMKKVQGTSISSQRYIANQQEQSRLHGNSRMIKDSLFALSKRIFKLAPTVNKETSELETNMGAAADALENRRVGDAATRQQYVMTHTNNLALMLNELLSNLMQMQNQGSQGSASSPTQGKPKPGAGQQLSDIITKQQQLGNGMQQMPGQKGQQGQEGQQGGNQGKGNQEGEGEGEYGSSEQLARMAEQQAAIRRQLQELSSLLNSKGLGNAKELKDIQDQMDKNETDLVNKRTNTSEFLQRQKEIMTRLLKAEKSLREQEQDDKRSSKSATEISRPIPAELQKYLQDKNKMMEMYRTIPPQLKPYYKNMVQQYFNIIGQ